MIQVTVTADVDQAHEFLVRLSGKIERPKELNAELGDALATMLQAHFRTRNREPNKMGAPKTNFWEDISASTQVEEVTNDGVTVKIAESRFRIHLQGGVIKPTGGRKSLTIPLIAEARGKRVKDYGKNLFRIGNALFEKSEEGDRSLLGTTRVSVRSRSGKSTRKVSLRGRPQIRAVYALVKKVTIKRDPNALPDSKKILDALSKAANIWLDHEIKKGGAA